VSIRLHKQFYQLIILLSAFLMQFNAFSQEVIRYKFGSEISYSPSYNGIIHHQGSLLSQSTFDTVNANEFGRFVQPIVLNFTYDPIPKLRFKIGVGYQELGYSSSRFSSQLDNNSFVEVSFREVSRFLQVPVSIQFFALKSFYLEASYVPLVFVNTKNTQYYTSEELDLNVIHVSRNGFNDYNHLLAFSIGYQARLGESSVSISLAPKFSYSLGFVEQSSDYIQRSHWQLGINLGIHTFL